MNTEKILKESKTIMTVAFVIGIILLAIGVIFSFMKLTLIPNNRAIIGLSFIPLGIAFVYYVKMSRIKGSPQKMKSIIISESDERLVALKNEADFIAFKITQGVVFLTYMVYTLMVPGDIFESVGWWISMTLLFTTFMSQGILRAIALRKEKATVDE